MGSTLTKGRGPLRQATGRVAMRASEIEYAFARRRAFQAELMAKSPAVPGTPPADTPLPASYEAALAELEQLVGQMESGALPLEQLLGSYQRGAALLQFCRGKLDAVEAQVKLLEDGQLQNWDAA
jgi:exodeoxyribonuclease VII small subunit